MIVVREFATVASAFLGLIVIIILVCRERVCWHWKINQEKDLLNSINQKLSYVEQQVEILASIDKTLKATSRLEVEKNIQDNTYRRENVICYSSLSKGKTPRKDEVYYEDDALYNPNGHRLYRRL